MKERPILFSTPMVQAILEGRKTQTRRVIRFQPDEDGLAFDLIKRGWFDTSGREYKCPYGQPGDRLWVRESWAKAIHGCGVELLERWEPGKEGPFGVGAIYAATPHKGYSVGKWKPSIHMPRWASRITLDVTGVRVERLQKIDEGDSQREGCERPILQDMGPDLHPYTGYYRDAFKDLWQSINGPGSWERNEFVWVVEFKAC